MKNLATDYKAAFSETKGKAMLTVAVQGGLCNRMRAMLSAAAVAVGSNSNVRVAWSNNAECGCDFTDLFVAPPLGQLGIAGNFSVTPTAFCDVPSSRKNLWIPSLFRLLRYNACRKNYSGPKGDDIHTLLSRYGKVYVSTCYEFCDSPIRMKDLFKPAAGVLEAVDRIAAGFNGNTIGMHIRTGDNEMSLRHSPARLFLDKAREELKRNPETVFFLATDSAQVKAAFNAKYPGKVITADESLSRSTVEGMKAAAVDLYALSRTKKIYGSYFSSFSGTAAEIGEIPIRILKL